MTTLLTDSEGAVILASEDDVVIWLPSSNKTNRISQIKVNIYSILIGQASQESSEKDPALIYMGCQDGKIRAFAQDGNTPYLSWMATMKT